MANLPPNFGQELHLTASRPMSSFVDAPNNRIRLEAKLEDGSELFLWLSKEQFLISLQTLRLGAQKLGVEWPKSLTI